MIADDKYMKKLKETYGHGEAIVTLELEQIIYDRLGKEPELYEYTEQDLHEQVRKLVMKYQTSEGRIEILEEKTEKDRQKGEEKNDSNGWF